MSKDENNNGSWDAPEKTDERYVLRLYVTGMTPRSVNAIENIKRIAEENFPGRYELEIIDIYQHPEAAKEAQLLAAPTMVKMLPLPLRRFVGDMSNEEKILVGLDLRPITEAKDE
ncbi:MAG: circadian clock KaiB family protein [Armatimonadota bacterium]